MLQNLTRPLAFFDIEATGLNRKFDRVIEITVILCLPDDKRETHTFTVNPGMPIPPDSTEIHGITNADVKDKPFFKDIIDDIDAVFKGADLGGYNILHYDIPMLQEEYARCNRRFEIDDRRLIDAQKIYHAREPRTLSAALKFYAGLDHDKAHNAEADVIATIQVLEGQWKKYEDLPHDIDKLHEVCNPRDPAWVDRKGNLKKINGDVCINFGRKQGEKLKHLAKNDVPFCIWILHNDFPRDMKDIVEDYLFAADNLPKKYRQKKFAREGKEDPDAKKETRDRSGGGKSSGGKSSGGKPSGGRHSGGKHSRGRHGGGKQGHRKDKGPRRHVTPPVSNTVLSDDILKNITVKPADSTPPPAEKPPSSENKAPTPESKTPPPAAPTPPPEDKPQAPTEL